MSVELVWALITGAALFGVGIYGALSQTNLVMIMMGVELILAGALINLVAFWRYLPAPRRHVRTNVCVDRDDSDGTGNGRGLWRCHCTFSQQRFR